MKIEIIQKFYDYSWRIHNPYVEFTSEQLDFKNVNVTVYIKLTDDSGKNWELLDNGNRFNNEISQNEHSRYDLILNKFNIQHKSNHKHRFIMGYEHENISNYNSIIFRCCELKPDFNPELTDTIDLSSDARKPYKEHYIGFAEQFIEIDYDLFPKDLDENPYIQCGIRCEMRPINKMYKWLNINNPMKGDDYDECCRKQTQIILLNNFTEKEATNALNNAIENELDILDLGYNLMDIFNVIERYKRVHNEE